MIDEKEKIVRGSGNIFADLGLPDAQNRKLKAQMAMHISRLMKQKGMTQAQLGALVGLDQPKVSKMLRGQLGEFSVERLFGVVNRLGRNIEVRVLETEVAPENARMSLIGYGVPANKRIKETGEVGLSQDNAGVVVEHTIGERRAGIGDVGIVGAASVASMGSTGVGSEHSTKLTGKREREIRSVG